MRRPNRILLLGSLWLAASSGCHLTPSNEKSDSASARPPWKVKLGGEGLRLGQLDRTTLAPGQFLVEVEQRMNAGREAAAKRMIRHYPDVALETLRTEAIHTPASASMRVVALAYDEQAGSGLAYLSSGAEAEGLRWLDAARKTFAAAGLDAPLRQCMANEIRYLDQKGKTSEAQALRDQLQALGK